MSHRLCRSLPVTMVTTQILCIFDPRPRRARSQRPGHPQGRLYISISSRPTVLPHMAPLTAPHNIRYNPHNRSPSRSTSRSTSNMSSFLLAPQPFPACPTITSSNLRNSKQYIDPTT